MSEDSAADDGRSWGWAALAGAVSLGLGLGVGELVAGLMARAETPFVAVGEAFIDLVPPWLKDLAVELFGRNDKRALLVGMALVMSVLGAVIGTVAARRLGLGVALTLGLVVVAAVAVLSRPDTTTTDLLPTLAAGAVGLGALAYLVPRAGPPPRDHPDSALESGRRTFLRATLVLAVGGTAAALAGRWLGARRVGVDAAREMLADGLSLTPAEVPAGADLGVSGAQPWRTPNDTFYRIDTAFQVPLVDPGDWRLRVHGMVENELDLSFADLIGLGLVDRWVTLACVSNPVGGDLVGNARWTGVPIAEVLRLAKPSPDADAVLSTSDDGWTAGTPLEALTDGRDSLLAVGMNGEPLPVEHGFPVRMVVPGLYGYVSATKWVVDLEVTRFDRFDAYWTTRGWSEQGPIKVASRIDVPRNDVEAGMVVVAGSAWSQHVGIEAVEVRVDDGEWHRATLGEVPSADTWRQWSWEWDAPAGEHRLQVRATTADGEVQTSDAAPPAPDGSTGWHSVSVDVR
jgi:DMSO/TMAO reductase YedYZ molybdopterin-dependent catalytic subunit